MGGLILGTLIVEARYLIPVFPRGKIIRDGAVVVEDGEIVFVGKVDEARRKFASGERIRGETHVAIPGLINAHTHLFQSILRNIGIDMELVSWLRRAIHPALASFTEEDFYIAAKWGLVENIRSGVTALIENHYGPVGHDAVAKALKEVGLRSVLARGIYELNVLLDLLKEEPEDALKDVERLVLEYHRPEEGKMMVAVAPMHPYNSSKELMLKAKELANKYGLIYHTHTAESPKDQELVKKLHGDTDVRLLYKWGILSERYHAVHAVNVDSEEVTLLAKTGAHVIHNPESNMYLGSGVAPIPDYLKTGVNVALASDGPGSNNNQDMVEAMRFAVLLHRASRRHPSIVTAWDALEMATINGARAMGIEKLVGSLEVGKRGDITLIDLSGPHIAPVHDPLGSIVYCANMSDVDTVVVDGEIYMESKKIAVLDEERVREEATKAALRVLDRARSKFDIKFPFEDFIE